MSDLFFLGIIATAMWLFLLWLAGKAEDRYGPVSWIGNRVRYYSAIALNVVAIMLAGGIYGA